MLWIYILFFQKKGSTVFLVCAEFICIHRWDVTNRFIIQSLISKTNSKTVQQSNLCFSKREIEWSMKILPEYPVLRFHDLLDHWIIAFLSKNYLKC